LSGSCEARNTGTSYDESWNNWARTHVDVLRREVQAAFDKEVEDLEDLAREMGRVTGPLERRINELTTKQAGDDLRAEMRQ